MKKELSSEAFRFLARLGAGVRLRALEEEKSMLFGLFPELKPRNLGPTEEVAPKQAKKRRVSIAERRAISKRMKALWASRRKAWKH